MAEVKKKKSSAVEGGCELSSNQEGQIPVS